ncbi:2-hydroxyhepta-2,4-diene-1,7-dioate isomerase [Glutamicibacter uratoxydans]|uniref:2-hydroxyhepta-2,4-diene-1,7-dioate isomerase n=1 Tax=Glutamicibacter uratoxydans TaxID=43667 RepID=A0A4Y4DKF9_GLUUR|nr:fumarylacetoacetate hydrolase family protein [Glutamicibacter uratoxydans]GED05073.1 2-hydroxyhepta-2,4-diene-1,7-dioate isomerase [Glutamicibacter uratoxydans]
MKLATIQWEGQTRAAVQVSEGYLPLNARDLSELLSDGAWKQQLETALAAYAHNDAVPADAIEVLNPLPRPAKVICCGLNYSEHILEMGRELPEHPTLFAKYADTLTGPDAQIISRHSQHVDWEAELAVVVGERLADATPEEAAAAIAGYTVANDVSMRDWQRRTLQWFQGKAFDASTPIGPVIATADEVDPEAGLEVICRINGEEVQRGNTKTLVFSAARLVAYISQFTTLQPGDLILTGTPGGVGMGMEPPRFLQDGDVLETEIPGIGTLTNKISIRVAAESAA